MANKKTKSAEEIAMSSIAEEFQGESDRIVAIVGGAYLDELLTSLLHSVFIGEKDAEALLSEFGPLGSNGSRCKLAYCLGLIRKHQRDDLATVAKIRNKFAHIHTSLSFDVAPISELCKNLKQAQFLDTLRAANARYKVNKSSLTLSLSKGGDPITVEGYIKSSTDTPRQRFTTTVVTLAGSLLRRIKLVSRKDEKNWFSKNPDPGIPS